MNINLSATVLYVSKNNITKAQIEQKLKSKHEQRVFFDVNFSGLDLSGMDFSDAVFINVSIDKTVFKGADLHSARFYECSVTDTDFSLADLTKAKFIKGDLSHSVFEKAKMDNVEVYGLTFWNNDVSNASSQKSRFVRTDLADSSFDGSDLQSSDFSTAFYDYTSFVGANCRKSLFSYEPRSDYADFENADITGAMMFKDEAVPVGEAIKEDG